MLDPKIKQLIETIKKIESAHLKSDRKEEMLSLEWQFIFEDWDRWVVLDLSTNSPGGYWIYSMLHPESRIDELKEELPDFNFMQSGAAYSEVESGGDHWIEPFWDEDKSFNDSSIPIYFDREYYGNPKGEKQYIEFNQIVTHPLDLHWSSRKQAYCKLDEHGEEIDYIKVIQNDDLNIILMERGQLDKLLFLGKWKLVRYFDFNRSKIDFPGFNRLDCRIEENLEAGIIQQVCTKGKDDVVYIEFRGAQILGPLSSKEQVLPSVHNRYERNEDDYCKFIVHDWKNNRILKNYSLKPSNFSNYFTKSDLPFEVSPIYFKAEVLDKYKNNPDKFNLSERSISCVGGWSLKTYDINKYNQVHTYAIYLGRLPYKEQLHWLQYNEEGKEGISERAYKTDFEGQWAEASPLQQLKTYLEELGELATENGSKIWEPKNGTWEEASRGLHNVSSENSNQWHDFIISLTNVANEGFQTKTLRSIATKLGTPSNDLRSLGLIKFILTTSGREDLLPSTYEILIELQKMRGQGKAHGAWKTPEGSLIQDAKSRLEDTVIAIKSLIEFFRDLINRARL